ncbi:TrbI/VirB10 family protein [Cupriavidus basilensis]|uniref:TrbI/VirB10 family protein n=1 Tax=Cupriavidus basilensis TaxID=68895 RepID=UPI0007515540|nr:TrbI/VirB10 family protein [Cupriavidus basilensis]
MRRDRGNRDKNVSDVSDAQERTVKGKLPRNIVYSLGAVAAVLVGVLGYFYQSQADAKLDAKAEEDRAAQLKQRADTAEGGQSLDRTIRDQQQKAREEAERQRQLAVKPDAGGKTPVMTARDLGGQVEKSGPDAAKNELDSIYTSPVFKTGNRKSQINQVKAPSAGLVDVTDPVQMRLLQQAAAARTAAATAAATNEPTAASISSDKQFLKDAAAASTQRTSFDGKLPKCTLSRGFVIPANFVGGMNSDKPGEFRATVTQDVYDTVKGDCRVIPAGSTLVGVYNSDIAVGQERLLAAFIRMQLPNKKTVPLLGMQGADPNGYAGISGDVNSHFWKIFGGALVIGALQLRFNDTPTATTFGAGGVTAYSNAAGQVATQTAQTILNRNQGIRPTITTKPGQKMMVQVNHDMVLEPYRD